MRKENILQADQPVQKKKRKRNKKKREEKKLVTRLTNPYRPISRPHTAIIQESEYSSSNSRKVLEWLGFEEIDPETEIKTIEIQYTQMSGQCCEIRLIDKMEKTIAEAGYKHIVDDYITQKIELEEGEKIMGIKYRQELPQLC